MSDPAKRPTADALLLGRTFTGTAPPPKTGESACKHPVETLYGKGDSCPVTFAGDAPLMTVAPNSADRATAVIIPNLLHYDGPTVVIDPDGRYYKATAEARQRMRQRVVRLDPFGVVDEGTDAINPFDLVEPGATITEVDCQELARLLWGRPDHHDSLDSMAFGLLTGVIGYLLTVPEKRRFQELVPTFHSDDVVYNLAVVLDTIGKKIPPLAYQEIAQFLQSEDAERAKILTRVRNRLRPFVSKEVSNTLAASSVPLVEVVGGEPVSVYLIVPATKMKSHAEVLQVWLSTLLQGILRRRADAPRRTLFILDETAQLESFPLLESALTLCRGRGLQVWTFWQDLSQIRSLYPASWPTMIGQSEVVQVFGRKDYAAAAELEAATGIEVRDFCQLKADEQILCLAGKGHKARKWSGPVQ